MSTVHLVGNPAAGAGRGRQRLGDAERALAALGADVEVLTAPDAAALRDHVRAVVAEGTERVVVVGGDGMVHLVVQELAATEIAVGLIPSGTGNDFADACGVPRDVDVAAAVALGDTRPIDLIRVTDGSAAGKFAGGSAESWGWAASVATFGFSGDVNARANAMRWPRGSSRYTLATIAELPRLRARSVTITVDDGTTVSTDATLVAAGNTSSFGGGMRICPAAEPDDGMLDVTVVGAVGRVRLLRFFRRVFAGTHLDLPEVSTLRSRRVEITTPAPWWADGEPLAREPIPAIETPAPGDGPAPATTVLECVPAALHLAH